MSHEKQKAIHPLPYLRPPLPTDEQRFRLMSNDAVQRVRIWGRLPCGKCKKRLELVRLEG
jgi:hypothetical protein